MFESLYDGKSKAILKMLEFLDVLMQNRVNCSSQAYLI